MEMGVEFLTSPRVCDYSEKHILICLTCFVGRLLVPPLAHWRNQSIVRDSVTT